MKAILTLIGAIAISGCATEIPYSNDQQCAFQNMIPVGYNYSEGSGVAYSPRAGLINSSFDSSGVVCGLPKDEVQQCKVQSLKDATQPIAEYNSGMIFKRDVTAIGYIALIIPGIIAKTEYDKAADRAKQKASEIYRQESVVCGEAKIQNQTSTTDQSSCADKCEALTKDNISVSVMDCMKKVCPENQSQN